MELAFATMVLAVMLGISGWVVLVLGVQGQCQTTANEVARQLARGDVAAVARVVAEAPRGASVTKVSKDGVVEVVVTKEMRLGSWAAHGVAARARVLEE